MSDKLLSSPLADLEQRDAFVHRHLGPNSDELARMCATIGVGDIDELIAHRPTIDGKVGDARNADEHVDPPLKVVYVRVCIRATQCQDPPYNLEPVGWGKSRVGIKCRCDRWVGRQRGFQR